MMMPIMAKTTKATREMPGRDEAGKDSGEEEDNGDRMT
jgi:hypothetical protein